VLVNDDSSDGTARCPQHSLHCFELSNEVNQEQLIYVTSYKEVILHTANLGLWH